MTTGAKSKTYLDAGGAGDSGWTEITAVADVDMADSWDSDKFATRESPFKKAVLGARDISISFNLKVKNGNAVFEAQRDAFNAGTVIGIANYIGDILTTGAQGIQMDCLITEMPKKIPYGSQVNCDIKLEPAYESTFEPVWAETA